MKFQLLCCLLASSLRSSLAWIQATDRNLVFSPVSTLSVSPITRSHCLDRGLCAQSSDDVVIGAASSMEEENMVRTRSQQRHIGWTVADLFQNPPALAVLYHSIGTAYDLSTPFGAVVGAISQPLFFGGTPFWQVVGNGSLLCGFTGMAAGAAYCGFKAAQGAGATPLPWDAVGLRDRQYRLSENSLVRLLDAGTYAGLASGGIAVLVIGAPSSGALGVLQALSIGASAGSLLTLAYYKTSVQKE